MNATEFFENYEDGTVYRITAGQNVFYSWVHYYDDFEHGIRRELSATSRTVEGVRRQADRELEKIKEG